MTVGLRDERLEEASLAIRGEKRAGPARVADATPPRPGDELQTLRRGLQALEFLNLKGVVTVGALSAHLSIPRPNAHRILQTLLAGGYCSRIPNSGSYIVGPAVRRLSSGLGEEEILTHVSIPIVMELGDSLDWPIALAVRRGAQVVARLTTDRSAPMALNRIPPGLPGHLLRTTSGLLSIAYAPLEERDGLIDAALKDQHITDFFPSRGYLHRILEGCLDTGYIILHSEYSESCLGVPIVYKGRLRGALVFRYMKVALSERRLVEDYLPRLTAARDRIVEGLELMERGQDEEDDCGVAHPQSGHAQEGA